MVQYLRSTYGLGIRRACRVIPLARSTYKYQSRAPQHTALRQRIRDLALSRVGWGYRRLTTLLQREGWPVGKGLVYRLYREENLLIRPKKRRRRVNHQARILQSTPNQLNLNSTRKCNRRCSWHRKGQLVYFSWPFQTQLPTEALMRKYRQLTEHQVYQI